MIEEINNIEATSSESSKRRRIPGRRTLIAAATPYEEKILISEDILLEIGRLADLHGIRIYCVGGYIRDYYLKNQRNDFDFTVVGDSIDFAKKVAEHFHTTTVVYPRFRTAMVPIGKYKCEFVGTRRETYMPESRKPNVIEGTLEDDLRRRDFTINALAVSLNKEDIGQIIDIFDGKSDLDKKILRTPLNPEITFSDDPLRMMRAARFTSQLQFFLHPGAVAAISKLANRISIVSTERITDEFMKIVGSPKPSSGLKILFDTGVLQYIFPELHNMAGVQVVRIADREYAHKDILVHSFHVLDNISQMTNNLWLRFSALIHDIAKPKTKRFVGGVGWTFHGHEEIGARWVERIFRQMKLPLEHMKYVETLVRLHQRPMALVDEGVTDSAVRRLAFHAGDTLTDLFFLCRADITTNNPRLSAQYLKNYDIVTQKVIDVQIKDKLREFQSPIRGEEIMEVCNIKPSRAVGYIKTAIEEAILDGIIPNDYDAANKYFLQHKDQWLKEYEAIYSEVI